MYDSIIISMFLKSALIFYSSVSVLLLRTFGNLKTFLVVKTGGKVL